MNYDILQPAKDKIKSLVGLCAAHAAYEESDYHKEHKVQRLEEDIFGLQKKLYCLVAEVDGEYVGYITWMKQYSTWDAMEYIYMDCLYLEDNFRGFGIGEALMNHMIEFGRKENIHLIQWQTPDFNAKAIKFYKRIGATSKLKERFFLFIQ